MKRVGGLLVGAVLAAVLTAAFGVDLPGGAPQLSLHTASAEATNILPDHTYICVAVPPLTGQPQGSCADGEAEIKNDPNSGGAIVFYLKLILRLVNSLVGIAILLFMTVGGVQYITAFGDPGSIKKAKGRIQNGAVALILYMMMYAILTFLIPGGIYG